MRQRFKSRRDSACLAVLVVACLGTPTTAVSGRGLIHSGWRRILKRTINTRLLHANTAELNICYMVKYIERRTIAHLPSIAHPLVVVLTQIEDNVTIPNHIIWFELPVVVVWCVLTARMGWGLGATGGALRWDKTRQIGLGRTSGIVNRKLSTRQILAHKYTPRTLGQLQVTSSLGQKTLPLYLPLLKTA